MPPLPIVSLALAMLLCCSAPSRSAADTLWIRNGKAVPQASQLLDALAAAAEYGLRPRDYALDLAPDEIRSVLEGRADVPLRTRFDAALTAGAARFVTHLHQGRVSPQAAAFNVPAVPRAFDPMSAVRELATASDIRSSLARYEPRPPPYWLLKAALSKYRQLARQPDLNKLPSLPRRCVQPGTEYGGAPQLRSLLVALGDLRPEAAAAHREDWIVDDALVLALQRFQGRHGLEPDGVLGPRTFTALTAPLEGRLRQIELTLERWRWMSSIERPDIVVNIPQFMLYAMPRPNDPDRRMLEMGVIVGRNYPHTRTPIFVAAIEYVIFQPYWDIPLSIVRRELLPEIRKDPQYLERNHMEIVRGPGDDATALDVTPEAIEALAAGQLRLRQRPGADNALGPVKFVLPNPYSVYLHATPQTELFRRPQRAFSHGCIRVSDPAALAEYVLKNAPGDWNAEAVEAALCGSKTLRVDLTTPVRIVIFYGTAAATGSLGVLFFEDLYGHDRKLEALLALIRTAA